MQEYPGTKARKAIFTDVRELFRRAVDHHKRGQFPEAIAAYDRIIMLKSDHAAAYANRGHALNSLGRHAEALASYDLAIALKPNDALALHNRGNALYNLGRYDEALAACDRSFALEPGNVELHAIRGLTLRATGRLTEALASYDRAIALKPDYAQVHSNRGNVLCNLGRYDEALASYDRATALQPQHAQTQYNKALLLLRLGNYESGFELYERRWHRAAKYKMRKFAQPQWRGEPIEDKTVLLHTEQGLGDVIQMLRYLPLLKAEAARVVLELARPIRPLLGLMADGVVMIEPHSPPPSFDMHCPLMSLPLAFGTRVDTIPAQIPYLTAPAERMPMWRTRLLKSMPPRIGLVWSGNAAHENDRNRSIALDRLVPLFNVAGISFVSLQREYRDGDLPALARLPIERIDDCLRDFGDTAAAIEQCDLVISVDTAVAHLAGSLGKPLWLLLPFEPDWRWLLHRTDSPWYPTARLFRQTKIGDWEGVISTVVNELSALSEGHANDGKMALVADDFAFFA